MAQFSFRAECLSDVERFQSACSDAGVTVSLTIQSEPEFPDVDVELQSSSLLEKLRDQMRKLVDGHLMLQTLRECALNENSLERDYFLV